MTNFFCQEYPFLQYITNNFENGIITQVNSQVSISQIKERKKNTHIM